MSDHYWLSEDQISRMKTHFPHLHDVPRVDDRRVLGGIIHVLKKAYSGGMLHLNTGPQRTLYNRFFHWSEMDIFDKTFKELSSQSTSNRFQRT